VELVDEEQDILVSYLSKLSQEVTCQGLGVVERRDMPDQIIHLLFSKDVPMWMLNPAKSGTAVEYGCG